MYKPTQTDYLKAKQTIALNARKHTALDHQLQRARARHNINSYHDTIRSIDNLWKIYHDAKETVAQFEKNPDAMPPQISSYERKRNAEHRYRGTLK